MGMPEVPADIFFQALVEMLKLDSGWVPNAPDGALYIRPFMFATESHVGFVQVGNTGSVFSPVL